MKNVNKAILVGLASALVLFGLYTVVVSSISGVRFLQEQLLQFWPFLAALTGGFGIQVGLVSYIRRKMREKMSKGVVAATGTTSTVAMLSCCAHYAVNFLPVLGTTGVLTFLSQYQVELFWVGIVANVIGIGIISRLLWRLHTS